MNALVMPQYHFDLREKCSFLGAKSATFSDDANATRHAEYMAIHLGAFDPVGHVLVTNDAGAVVAICPAGRY